MDAIVCAIFQLPGMIIEIAFNFVAILAYRIRREQ
jgi:hypothetical protein